MEPPITVVGCRRLPAGQLVGDELLDVLALKLAGKDWLGVRLAEGGEEPDGVGVGLDRPGALVLGLQGAPETAVED
jgi:hypothetical protein